MYLDRAMEEMKMGRERMGEIFSEKERELVLPGLLYANGIMQ